MAGKQIMKGRRLADPPRGTVVFIIGMRINKIRRLRQWLPVASAMPRMLVELARQPDLGLLGVKTYVSGRTITTVQYWKDFEHLNDYASGRELAHLPAWRSFNQNVRNNGNVGVFHETYVIDRSEAVYVNMPEDFGLGGATGWVEPARKGQRAAHRLDPSVPDEPVVEAY